MDDPRIIFKAQLDMGQALCLLPLGRVLVETPTRLSDTLILYPPNFFLPEDLRVVSYPAYELQRTYSDNLPLMQSAATGVSLQEFFGSALLALPVEIDWKDLYRPKTHSVHLEMISRAAAKAEIVLDLVRFHHCCMVLPDTLPGPAGYLEQQGFSAGLFYSLTNHESYIIAGQIISHVVVVGLGLDMESLQLDDYPKGGQVENLARHGLRLYSAALTASDDTAKFMQLMTLLEFLSNPDNYEKMEKTKKCIACHVAHDPSEYDQIMNDFRFLTSDQNTPNRGLRHNIVHLGKRLEDLLSADEREAVLKRLDRYVGITLEDFIERGDADWETIDKYRKTRRSALGIQPE